MIVNLDNYKKAKTLVRDLTEIMNFLKTSIPLFAKYKKYSPVKRILFEMLEARAIVKRHLDKNQAVLKGKDSE